MPQKPSFFGLNILCGKDRAWSEFRAFVIQILGKAKPVSQLIQQRAQDFENLEKMTNR